MVTNIRSISVGGYKHNFEGFYKNFTYPIFINKERMTTTQGVHANLIETLPFLLVLSW